MEKIEDLKERVIMLEAAIHSMVLAALSSETRFGELFREFHAESSEKFSEECAGDWLDEWEDKQLSDLSYWDQSEI